MDGTTHTNTEIIEKELEEYLTEVLKDKDDVATFRIELQEPIKNTYSLSVELISKSFEVPSSPYDPMTVLNKIRETRGIPEYIDFIPGGGEGIFRVKLSRTHTLEPTDLEEKSKTLVSNDLKDLSSYITMVSTSLSNYKKGVDNLLTNLLKGGIFR